VSEAPLPEDRTVVGALAANEQRYASLFGLNPDPVFAFDRDGCLVSANPALERLTGYDSRELLGRPFLLLLVPEDRDRAWRHFVRALQGEAQSFEVSGTGRDGREFTLAATHIPMLVDGRIDGIYGTARDITRQKEAERALRETEERYRLLADNVQDMISLHDLEARFLFASPSAWKLTGYHPVELMGRRVYDLLVPEDVPVLQAAHRDIMERQGRQPAVYRARRADGSVGWYESTARMVTHEDTHQPWRIVAVTRDITERRALEQHVQQSNKMEALGRLAGGIAHDFNNILTVISGHAEMLTSMLEQGGPEREHAEHVREAARRAAALTRQLTTFGRRDAASVGVSDLNALILDMQPMLTRMLGDGVQFDVDLDPDLLGVGCEPAALEQVLVNLVVNARDAIRDGGRFSLRTRNVAIDAEITAAVPAGEYVQLTASDTGIGMSPDVAARVFEPFFTTKQQGEGAGLGLSTVYSIVQQAGGTAAVQSEPGAGSVFRLLFPGQQERPAVSRDGRYAPPAALRGTETVLVAEDDAGVRALVVAALQRYGYRVMAAIDGMQALELYRLYGHLIDLVVTDVNMPDLRGPELVRMLNESGSTLPVLYMSGFTSESLALTDEAPHRAFLAKPFTPIELGTAVRAILNRP